MSAATARVVELLRGDDWRVREALVEHLSSVPGASMRFDVDDERWVLEIDLDAFDQVVGR